MIRLITAHALYLRATLSLRRALHVLLLVLATTLVASPASAEMYSYQSTWQSSQHEHRVAYFDTADEARAWCHSQAASLGFATSYCQLGGGVQPGLALYGAGWLCVTGGSTCLAQSSNWHFVLLNAYFCEFGGRSDLGGPCGASDEQTCQTSNPVQPGTGRKRFTDTDYASAGAHPLSLVRDYSSRWTDGIETAGLVRIAAWDGGWRHAYQASLALRSDGSLRAWRPDGTLLRLSASTTAANTWTAADSRDIVTAIVDASGARTGYTLAVADDDSVETYDAVGKLLSLKARNGWLTTLSYSDATTPTTVAPTPGLLIGVKNQFGRELKFTYDSQGRLAELLPPGAVSGQPPGSAISPIRYVYNEAASLGAGTPARNQLSSVVWQDGAVKRYHYEDARWPQAVTGITDEAGVRFGTYAYDAQGRVTRSELVGGAQRLDFAYGRDVVGKPTTTVTDYSGAGGTATTRTYAFTDIANVRYPSSVSAPCSLCGSTAQATTYDTAGRKTKAVAHEGSVTFYAYDTKGRETERSSFPASFATATTRPALSNATRVVSTQWHATFKLPTQIAEPNKISSYAYSAKGMLTALSWSRTSDGTGAAKFGATKTSSTYATTWAYAASSLATTVVTKETALGSTTASETGRWTAAFSAVGDLTRMVDVKNGNRTATISQYDGQGRMLRGTSDLGTTLVLGYTPRGAVASQSRDGRTLNFIYNGVGNLATVRTPDGQTIDYVHDANQVLVDVKLNGVSITPQMLADSSYPATRWNVARAKEWLAIAIESLMTRAHAQVIVVPGDRGVRPPVFDPRTDMLMSPMSDSDKQLRALQEAFARFCECEPNNGYQKPTFTSKSYAHVFWGGHTSGMFSAMSLR